MAICTICGSLVSNDNTEHVHITGIMEDMFTLFATKLATVGQYMGPAYALMQYQNWAGISALRDQLVAATVITQDEANSITAIFANYGIILPS
jgi:hypothetical protein